jgi:NADPH:quinone reductase-like Zn-dependent oxidoreductase
VATLKRIQYHRYGGPEVLRLEDFEPAPPGRGEVLVHVRAAAANAMDWKIRNGQMKLMTGRTFPRGLGHDFAGTVAAVGAGVTRLRVGDAVLGAASIKAAGAFAEMVIADEKAVVSKPAGLSYEPVSRMSRQRRSQS